MSTPLGPDRPPARTTHPRPIRSWTRTPATIDQAAQRLREGLARAHRDRPTHGDRLVLGVRAGDLEAVLDDRADCRAHHPDPFNIDDDDPQEPR